MNYTKPLIILIVILLLTPIITYTINFWGQALSGKTEIWGQFGDFLNGTFTPIIGLIGILVTLKLGFISDRRDETNISIEQQKQRPILHLGYVDAENLLRINIKNKGSGPLIISKFRLVNLTSGEELNSIFECLPTIENTFDFYTGNQENTILSSDEEQELFKFELNNDKNKHFSSDRDIIRKSISQFKVVLEYKDVYNNLMPTYERSLSWFGRNLDE